MSYKLTYQHKKHNTMEIRKNFPIDLVIYGNSYWCKLVNEGEYSKLVTSKFFTLFVINKFPGMGLSTFNSQKDTDRLVKDSTTIMSLVEKINNNKYPTIQLNLEINLVKTGTAVKITEDDGIESWTICKDNKMHKNTYSRGTRYFIA